MNRPVPTLGNPKNTIEILNKYKFIFQKKFGQNFLIDEHVLGKIIRSAEITEDDFKIAEKDLQELTDKYCKDIDKAVESKEKEIMEV